MNEKIQMEFKRWLQSPLIDAEAKKELEAAASSYAELEDRFYTGLSFGTGGLRGVLGMGTNRMNIYTVRKATQGLCDYLNGTQLKKRVAIAHDSRINSDLFAREAACVLAANGIQAHLYPRLEPTPALSFAVRDLDCGAGICVTASHNPAKYNGYKVYGPDGCQITLEAADEISARIEAIDILSGVKLVDFDQGLASGLIRWISEETLDRFIQAVKAQSLGQAENLKVVYTPLNGSGLECVTRILKQIGIHDVTVVPEQAMPDGNFPTCPYPNPEMREALEKGLALCRKVKPDLLLATDPDCDRVGIAVPDGDDYALLTGNEVGVLLMDYVCRRRLETGRMPKDPVMVTTIVSTDMAAAVSDEYGVELRRTLTGFKFIGEQIGLLEKDGEADRYLFGFEESYGYLSGSHVRDKDGVNAAMLICEMASFYQKQGVTLLEAMRALYEKHGYFLNSLHSFAFEGASGMEAMALLMGRLRENPPERIAEVPVRLLEDYKKGVNGLPLSDVLAFTLIDGCKVMLRPSGTEPKLKAYLFTVGRTLDEARARDKALTNALKGLVK